MHDINTINALNGSVNPDVMGRGLVVTANRQDVAAHAERLAAAIGPDGANPIPEDGEIDSMTAIRAMGLDPDRKARPDDHDVTIMRQTIFTLGATGVAVPTHTGLRRGAMYEAHRERLLARLRLIQDLPVGAIIPGEPVEV